MTWLAIALGFVAAWLIFNWLAPLATLERAEHMSTGRVPALFVEIARAQRVDFYVSTLHRGPGFSAWVWPRHIVVLDRRFLGALTPEHVRFVLGHELGHVALGHLRWRWAAVVSGAVLLPAVRARLRAHEDDADAYATALTGFKREFWDRLGGGAANEETAQHAAAD